MSKESESIQIKIAESDYTVRRLTLRQSIAIGKCVSRPVPTDDGYSYAIEQAISVITAALSRDHSEMTADALLDAEVAPKELTAISGSILRFGGFLKTAAQGEESPPVVG